CPSSATNHATFTQNSTQAAVANATKGATVTQTQSTPLCVTSPSTGPYNPPASCLAPGGLVGTINQDSSGQSTAQPTQAEVQYADAGATQVNLGRADCTTDGACTASQTTTTNGGMTQDGYQAPSIGNLNITCDPAVNNGQCRGTPPPDPINVSGPASDPNPSS